MFRLHVILTPSEEVLSLRREVQELRESIDQLRQDIHRLEYRYGCEVSMNSQILDWCKQNGIELPKRFYDRPY